MAPWFEKVVSVLAGTPDPARNVDRQLDDALRHRVRIDLDLVGHTSPRCPGHLVTTIEHIRDHDIVIAQPTAGGLPYPLTTGEQLQLSFVSGSSIVSADTRCLGRDRMPSGTGGIFYGYRLHKPDHVSIEPRKTFMPEHAGLALTSEVELLPPRDQSNAVRGVVHDLFPAGMKIRSRNAAGRLHVGQRVYMRTAFPSPVGTLEEMVIVRDVSPGDVDDQRVISIEFEHRHDAYESLVEGLVRDKWSGGRRRQPRRAVA